MELNTIQIVWEGRPATLNILRDVTPQKKMETQFLQAQKMEAIGTLAGGIAHDFDRLLMGIQGNASLILLDMEPHHSHHDKLRSIEQLVKGGADLTKQLLGMARRGKNAGRSLLEEAAPIIFLDRFIFCFQYISPR